MEGTQKYKYTIHWVQKQVPIVLSEFRKMCIKFEFLARKIEMEWKTANHTYLGKIRTDLSCRSLLSCPRSWSSCCCWCCCCWVGVVVSWILMDSWLFWNFYGNFDGFLNFGGFLDFDDSLSEFGQLFNFIHFAHHMSRLLHCYVTVEQQWEDISNEISLMSCCDVF